jgi:hypothetical protein
MNDDVQSLSIKGKEHAVPAVKFGDAVVLITGKIPKIARIFDEAWVESRGLPNPLEIVDKLRAMRRPPDIFTFAQRIPDLTPHYPYHYELENVAAVTVESYSSWFEKDIARTARQHIRKAQREGIVAEIVSFDDRLVEGICSIFNELKVRQGKQFWHYGKSFETVKRENGTYLDRSLFIGAYSGTELVGFLKCVIDGEVANIMQIISKSSHFQKRPNNALLCKAVEVCESRKVKYLIYGEHTYGKKAESSLTDFKEKNGFKKMEFPRYYVPLTIKGHAAIKLGIHKGWSNLVPGFVTQNLVSLRSKYYEWRTGHDKQSKQTQQSPHAEVEQR